MLITKHFSTWIYFACFPDFVKGTKVPEICHTIHQMAVFSWGYTNPMYIYILLYYIYVLYIYYITLYKLLPTGLVPTRSFLEGQLPLDSISDLHLPLVTGCCDRPGYDGLFVFEIAVVFEVDG